MGTDDFYVKFGTDADSDRWRQADWTLTGNLCLTEWPSYIRCQSVPGEGGGGLYKAILRDMPTEEWDMTVRMWASDGDSLKYHSMYIKLNDGYYYVVGSYSGPHPSAKIGWKRTLVRPTSAATNALTPGAVVGDYEVVRWWGLRFKTDGSVDMIEAAQTGTRDPPTMDVTDSNIITGVTAAKILEVGFYGEGDGSQTRFYRAKIGADPFTTTDLELGTAKIISQTALHAPAGQGYGKVLISDPRLANYATLLGNVKKLVSVRDTTYWNSFVLGEVDSLSIIDKDTVSLSISNNAVKARKQKCNHNQVIYSNFMKYVRDDAILDHVDAIPTGLTGYAVSMEKKNLKAMTIYPISLVEDHSPDTGDINSLYQEGEMLDYGSDKDYSNDYTQFTFHLYITSKNDITKLKLNLKYKIRAENNGYYINPLWEVFQNGAWWTLYEVDEEAEGGGYVPIDISHLDVLPMDMFTITNLLETVDSLNTSGYVEYSLKIRFFSGQRNVLDNDFHVYIFDIIQLVVETDNVEQPVTVGQGLVDAASDADIIVFDNVTPTRNIEKFPASEGFGDGDQYFITKWLDDIMIDIFNNADTLFSYSQNITDIEDHVIFTNDLTMEFIYNVLETVKSTLNAPWWLNTENNSIIQRSIDNLVATGLTLTNVDFVGGLAGISYVVDGKNIRTHATVIGKNDTVTSAIDEEYTPEGGNEEEIVVRPNISNPTALNKELLSLIKKHTNANVALSGTIDYSSLLQNYSSISLYKTIIVTLDDGDGNEIISKTLTITKLELNNSKATGYKDHVTLWLEVLIE